MAIQQLLDALFPEVLGGWPRAVGRGHTTALFVSVCDGHRRAETFHERGSDPEELWKIAAARCIAWEARAGAHAPCWLRVDVVTGVQASSWGALRARLAATRRNYFRLGLAVDADLQHAFLEGELNAHAVWYPRGDTAHAVINEENFRLFAKARFGLDAVSFSAEQPVYLLETRGWFVDESLQVFPLVAGHDSDAGRRQVPGVSTGQMIPTASRYLARQVGPKGRFTYGYFPCFDRAIPAYNALRHASTLISMLDAVEVFPSDDLGGAIDRAVRYLHGTLLRPYETPEGSRITHLVDEGGEIKLGGDAVALLALIRHARWTGSDAYAGCMEELGRAIVSMQDSRTGHFVHVLHGEDLSVKEVFRIVYYDGEAAYALACLYDHTRDPVWLNAVESAFTYFIAAEHWRTHDHWLAYAADMLTRFRPKAEYFEFAIRNVVDHLDFVLERDTTYPTLLELMMATHAILERMRPMAELAHLMHKMDSPRFYQALEHRARHLINGHFWPEWAMFFRSPDKVVGSFFIRHHAFRVRIDDVEHYLSGLVAYHRAFGSTGAAPQGTLASPVQGAGRWTADQLVAATGGEWWRAPTTPQWRAAGACVWPPAMRRGDLVFVRRPGTKGGMPAALLDRLPCPPAALVCVDPDALDGMDGRWSDTPVLRVADESRALLDLGRAARADVTACFIGVTGTAGKTTTVAMMAHGLAACGRVGRSRESANLPHGIAWNLASLDPDADLVVMELAVGHMARNAALVRPDIAVFTNIGPAHLQYHGSVAEIARKKALMFDAMQPGAVAVLNRDMLEWERVAQAARDRSLRVVSYGRHPESDVRLLAMDADTGSAQARAGSTDIRWTMAARGEHMALNALAVMAVAQELRLDLQQVAAQLGAFTALAGRGVHHALRLSSGIAVTLVDESFNANPVSMRAALEGVRAAVRNRLVLVLGDMLELGAEAPAWHLGLHPWIVGSGASLVLLVGPLMQPLALEEWPAGCRVFHFDTSVPATAWLVRHLQDGDTVLLKGSAGMRLSVVVDHLLGLSHGPPVPGGG